MVWKTRTSLERSPRSARVELACVIRVKRFRSSTPLSSATLHTGATLYSSKSRVELWAQAAVYLELYRYGITRETTSLCIKARRCRLVQPHRTSGGRPQYITKSHRTRNNLSPRASVFGVSDSFRPNRRMNMNRRPSDNLMAPVSKSCVTVSNRQLNW